MTLSCGSCRMTSCATVRPPMPESKTPTGAELLTRRPAASLDIDRRADHGAVRRRAESKLRLDVPEVGGDEAVGAGNEMIGDEQRDPVLDMGAACFDFRVAEPAGHFDRKSVHTVRDDE